MGKTVWIVQESDGKVVRVFKNEKRVKEWIEINGYTFTLDKSDKYNPLYTINEVGVQGECDYIVFKRFVE